MTSGHSENYTTLTDATNKKASPARATLLTVTERRRYADGHIHPSLLAMLTSSSALVAIIDRNRMAA
jgi:hypothetical protein